MINNIQKNIDNSYLFGCLKFKNQFSFYLMPVAYWVLNNLKYNPNYNPDEWEFVFRNNILNVDDDNIEPFIKSIEVDKIDIESINITDYDLMDIFLFYIDFDTKTFVSYFDDIDIEEYLPDENWTGKFDNPLNYLPNELLSKLR